MSGVSGTAAPATPPSAPAERVVARVRRHGRILILPAALLVVVTGATAYAVGWLEQPWQRFAALGVALLVVVVGSVLPFLAWLTRRTTITTRRIIQS